MLHTYVEIMQVYFLKMLPGVSFFFFEVECQQEGERVDQHSCEAIEQPDEQQPCYTGVACAKEFVSCERCFQRLHSFFKLLLSQRYTCKIVNYRSFIILFAHCLMIPTKECDTKYYHYGDQCN